MRHLLVACGAFLAASVAAPASHAQGSVKIGFIGTFSGQFADAANDAIEAIQAELGADDSAKMQRLIDALEGLDDVQDVFTSAVLTE